MRVSSFSKMLLLLLVSLVVAWSSCAQPHAKEMVGVFELRNNQGTVTLTLRADSTFEQRIVFAGSGKELLKRGTWRYEATRSELYLLGAVNVGEDSLMIGGPVSLSTDRMLGTVRLMVDPDAGMYYVKKR